MLNSRSAGGMTFATRVALIVLTALIIITFCAYDFAMQRLRAVLERDGSTVFHARTLRHALTAVPLRVAAGDAAPVTAGERLWLLSGAPGAGVSRRPAAARVATTVACERGRFAFPSGSLGLWCVGVERNASALHLLQLCRVDADAGAGGAASTFSSSSLLTSQTLAVAAMWVDGPIAPQGLDASFAAEAISVLDAAEVAAGSEKFAVVLLQEGTFGSVYSTTCASSSASSSAPAWSCTAARLVVNGNATASVGSAKVAQCTIRVVPHTGTDIPVVATCNYDAAARLQQLPPSSWPRPLLFTANISRSTQTMTGFWRSATLALSTDFAVDAGVPVFFSPVVSVPASASLASLLAAADTATAANNRALSHFTIAIAYSAARGRFTAFVADVSAAFVGGGANVLAPLPSSLTNLHATLCGAAPANCTCCDGWTLDPVVRTSGTDAIITSSSSSSSSSASDVAPFVSLVRAADSVAGGLVRLRVAIHGPLPTAADSEVLERAAAIVADSVSVESGSSNGADAARWVMPMFPSQLVVTGEATSAAVAASSSSSSSPLAPPLQSVVAATTYDAATRVAATSLFSHGASSVAPFAQRLQCPFSADERGASMQQRVAVGIKWVGRFAAASATTTERSDRDVRSAVVLACGLADDNLVALVLADDASWSQQRDVVYALGSVNPASIGAAAGTTAATTVDVVMLRDEYHAL